MFLNDGHEPAFLYTGNMNHVDRIIAGSYLDQFHFKNILVFIPLDPGTQAAFKRPPSPLRAAPAVESSHMGVSIYFHVLQAVMCVFHSRKL